MFVTYPKPGPNGEEAEVNSETSDLLAPFAFGVRYDTDQERYIGPGEPNSDLPADNYPNNDNESDSDLVGDNRSEEESHDSDYMPGNAGTNSNGSPNNHVMHEGPHYNLPSRDPTAVIPRVWNNYKSDTPATFWHRHHNVGHCQHDGGGWIVAHPLFPSRSSTRCQMAFYGR